MLQYIKKEGIGKISMNNDLMKIVEETKKLKRFYRLFTGRRLGLKGRKQR